MNDGIFNLSASQAMAKLEEEHHQLAIAIDEARTAATDRAMRQRQIELLLEITSIVAEIRNAPATMTEDFIALLDVALEHHLDLACDIAYHGPSDYPMTARLMCALADAVPGLNSAPSADGCRYRVSLSS